VASQSLASISTDAATLRGKTITGFMARTERAFLEESPVLWTLWTHPGSERGNRLRKMPHWSRGR